MGSSYFRAFLWLFLGFIGFRVCGDCETDADGTMR